jgi:hypothetical protein
MSSMMCNKVMASLLTQSDVLTTCGVARGGLIACMLAGLDIVDGIAGLWPSLGYPHSLLNKRCGCMW